MASKATTRKRSSATQRNRSKTRAKSATAKAKVSNDTDGRVATVLYVHGIGNKPLPDILKCQWDEALFGFNLGERSRLAYWVNRIFYPEPAQTSCKMADSTHDGTRDGTAGFTTRSVGMDVGVEGLVPADATGAERVVLERIAERAVAAPRDPGTLAAADFHARVLPLPKPLREFISRRITKAFLKDVHEFLFIEERRLAMRDSVVSRLKSGGGPFVVIGHSQGSMVAYDALCSLADDKDIEIDLLVTIGSPLGLKEVQDQLKTITGQKRLAVPKNVKQWLNVSDPLDPVCADKRLAGDYAPTNGVRVEDHVKFNEDSPRDPHSATGYLRLEPVRSAVRGAVDRALFQRIAQFTIARDLVNQLESGFKEDRHSVLIELRDQWSDAGDSQPLDVIRENVVRWIDRRIAALEPPLTHDEIEFEPTLHNYVSAKLTRAEIEQMSAELQLTNVYRVFKNARKRALLNESINVLQCATAHRGYDAMGGGITWAVLDTGIDAEHPHFGSGTPRSTVGRVFDCVRPGSIRTTGGIDRNGHGTHVAGIIAGGLAEMTGAVSAVSGLAPKAKLWSYKVLNDDGEGSDARIIKALDHIYRTNESAPSLVVHGVNLSLGGAYDPESFGCGDTPICKQVRKLWRQGVVVVLAAGNEGYLELQQGDEILGVNADLSIGDPANVEEAIAVGSIHKAKPHLYGISYFSSRGPTADGRCKPDVVAPGERILSCRAGARVRARAKPNADRLYVSMSGTSMAAPHVSGLIAGFLSARREFIGYPDRVTQILLDACTDLKRDRMHQGAGMPNLVKMLLST
jgi:subtilisin family serine protease